MGCCTSNGASVAVVVPVSSSSSSSHMVLPLPALSDDVLTCCCSSSGSSPSPTCFSIDLTSFSELPPTKTSSTSPFLMNTNVGILVMLYSTVMSSLSSTLTLRTTARSAYSAASSSSLGAIILHGPHQLAQKSMTISFSPALDNCCSKSSLLCTT
ncbi:hypothetical protein KR093_004181 [Drosophila rubida]|uniref:Uncharacterized protein n=1 Tax=Drosophila rubida TaxID=30044 RepID=A0AAD4PRG5_9MUSC|nr:hypothetical protein KR093_004181 [Drosophila rubida]